MSDAQSSGPSSGQNSAQRNAQSNRQRHGLRSSRFITWSSCLLVLLLVLFPKGGFRLAGLPITWGYILLAALTPLAAGARFLAMPLLFPRRVLGVILLLLPMQACFLYAGVFYGISNLNFTFSTFVGLFALPWIFLLLFGPFFPSADGEKLRSWFCACVFYAAIWGIVLFVLYPLTHHNIEIPFLTVNAGDAGTVENGKSNARGMFLKLVSTYNNGNIYGVATLLLFPLFVRLEPSRWRRGAVRLALLLTLSRTVWVGLLVNELLSLLPHLLRQVRTFPVLYLREVRRQLLAIAVTLVLVFGSIVLVTLQLSSVSFLFDRTLGNRVSQVSAASSVVTFFPEQALYGFGEVLYASAVQYWGLTGLFAFTLIMFSPLLVLPWSGDVLRSPIRRAALKALLVYTVTAASDGALDFIPVMAFYWFVYAVFLYGWPGMPARLQHARRRAPASPLPGPSLPGLAGA